MQTAQVLIVGNEILSGKTLDTNTQYLCRELSLRGVRVTRTFTVQDEIPEISAAIRGNHMKSDFFFVCGGIGGTPDDKTRQAVADAMDVPLVRQPMADKILTEYYRERANASRMSMADLPQGCAIIDNPVTRAPGFKIKNIYVFAGIPVLVKAMFENVKGDFQGQALFEKEMLLDVGEGEIAHFMEMVNKKFPGIELGSYPKMASEQFSKPFHERRFQTQLVMRGENQRQVEDAWHEFTTLVATVLRK